MKKFPRFLLGYSACILVVNLFLQVVTYRFPQTQAAAPILFLLILPMLLYLIPRQKQIQWMDCPKYLRMLFYCLFAYVVIQNIFCIYFLQEGMPRIVDGVHCIWSGGQVIREITPELYLRLSILEACMMVGTLLAFSSGALALLSALRVKYI